MIAYYSGLLKLQVITAYTRPYVPGSSAENQCIKADVPGSQVGPPMRQKKKTFEILDKHLKCPPVICTAKEKTLDPCT
jgi:hypothetical protein